MGDHYIPQYYLSGFASSENYMVWVYEKGGLLKFQSQVKNIAHETNYYSPEVERYLANEIEGPANSVIKKIRDRKQLTQSEKEILAIYMVVILKRVPQSKIRMKKTAPVVIQSLQQKWDKEISKLILENPSRTELLKNAGWKLKLILKNIQKIFPRIFGWILFLQKEHQIL